MSRKLASPGKEAVKDGELTPAGVAYLSQLADSHAPDSGTTAERPTKGLYPGFAFFDTTLGHMIWYYDASTTDWVDGVGTDV